MISKRTKFLIGAALAVLIPFWLSGCDMLPSGPTIVVTNTNTATVAGPGASPSPSANPGACAPATALTASVIEGQPIKVGDVVTLEVTIHVNGQIVDEESVCGKSKVITWSEFPPASVFSFVTSPTGYHPGLRARAPGQESTKVSVDGQTVTLVLRAEGRS